MRPQSGAAHAALAEEVELTLLMARVASIQIFSPALVDGEVNAPVAGAEEATAARLAGAAPSAEVSGTRDTTRWRAGTTLSRGVLAAGAGDVHLE